MAKKTGSRRHLGSALLGVALLAVAGGVAWSLFGRHTESLAQQPGATTASIEPARNTGPSGLPIPRFVSLKAERINVRRGPSSDHPVAWVFERKGLPVEIVAEFEHWRRIRDSEGEEGWILQSMLSGKRTAIVAPWKGAKQTSLHSAADKASSTVALLASGAMAEITHCDGDWCELSAGGFDGFVEQTALWGVYPGETVD
jgi:SH3-like domain-containing protein